MEPITLNALTPTTLPILYIQTSVWATLMTDNGIGSCVPDLDGIFAFPLQT